MWPFKPRPIVIHVHVEPSAWLMLLDKLNTLERKLIMTHQELANALSGIGTQLDKVSAEITALKEQIAQADNVPQFVIDAVNSIQAKVQAADDLVPDAPTP